MLTSCTPSSEPVYVPGFKLIGLNLTHKTRNLNDQSSKACGALWTEFERSGVPSLLPSKETEAIYAVYYDYESDENGLFGYFIGCKVPHHIAPPPQLDELYIPNQRCIKFTAAGPLPDSIREAWCYIWQADFPRSFGFDVEIYDHRSQDWSQAEVDLYLSIN